MRLTDKPYYKQPWYNSYRSMMDRCYRKDAHNYPLYGGRGIEVCEEWQDIESFAIWCEQSGYREGLTIVGGRKMIKCRDCKYCQMYKESIGTCTLTKNVTDADKEHDCQCYNRDLSEYDICYNCKYYIGIGDWGLFCSHKDMYHHLGKFCDDPCEKYEKKL